MLVGECFEPGAPAARQLDAGGVVVTSAEVSRPTLDDVFLTLTGRSLREEGAADDDPAGVAAGADAAVLA